MWVEFVGSLFCTERFFFSEYPGFPSPAKPTSDLICVNCSFQLTVSLISSPALERLDTEIKFLSIPLVTLLLLFFLSSSTGNNRLGKL